MGVLELFRLDGKVAVVTGGSRGLGQGMATGLAEAGADVAVVSRGEARQTRERIEALGRRCAVVRADLMDASAAAMTRIVEEAARALGRVDILVNNAGIIRRAGVLEFSQDDWDEVIAVNQRAVFFLSQAAAKVMVKQGWGGRIINVASMLSFQGGIRVAAYTAAKSAVMGLTRAFANELASHRINVNAIAPGYMATDNTAPLRADEKRSAEILARIPAGRWGTPEDLQGVAVFLAAPASEYLTGYTIAVDGGWLAR